MHLEGLTDTLTVTIVVQHLQIVYYCLVPLEGAKVVPYEITETKEVIPNLFHLFRPESILRREPSER